MLRLIYYKYHSGGDLPAVKVAELIRFLSEKIIPDPFFGTPLCIPFGRELPQ